MNTNIEGDFQICINAPLTNLDLSINTIDLTNSVEYL